MRSRAIASRAFISAFSLLLACVSDDSAKDSGPPEDATTKETSVNDSSFDSPDVAVIINGCTTFVDDRSVQSPTVIGPTTATPAQYAPPCIRVKAGQSVVFTGDFTDHPLEAMGGSSGNPITTTSSGTLATFTFSTPGVYGFACANHPTDMLGAIEVTSS